MARTPSGAVLEMPYVNWYGDDWVFRYDPETATGTVEGSNVDWCSYPVVRGFVPCDDLELSSDETLWLWRSWRQAIDRYGDPGIYGVAQAQAQSGPGRTAKQGPAEGFCPLCLEHRKVFEYHHCVWRSAGGTDHHKNVLSICKSCHALLTHGDPEDSRRRDLAAYYHQAARFAAAFYYNASPGERKLGQSVWPGSIENKPRAVRLEHGHMLRNHLEARYIYYRDTALERLPRFDLLTFDLSYKKVGFKHFERDRAEYINRWRCG